MLRGLAWRLHLRRQMTSSVLASLGIETGDDLRFIPQPTFTAFQSAVFFVWGWSIPDRSNETIIDNPLTGRRYGAASNQVRLTVIFQLEDSNAGHFQ